jgi:nitroreductase
MTTYAPETLTDVLALSPEAQDLLFREARTANSFTDEPVTNEQVTAIYDLVKWAPTSMNIQPLRVLLVRSDEARARLLDHLAPGNRAKSGSAPLVAVLSVDHSFHDHLHRTFPHFPGAKAVFADEAVRADAARLNGALQLAYFILGVRAAGLDAGPLGGFDHEALDREFFPDGAHEAVLVVNIGHAASDAFRPRNPRLDYEDVFAAA